MCAKLLDLNLAKVRRAKFLRHKDRATNAHRYPLLTYPEVYILDGGYSSFFMDHRFRCFPQNYVEMAAKEHANACERRLLHSASIINLWTTAPLPPIGSAALP